LSSLLLLLSSSPSLRALLLLLLLLLVLLLLSLLLVYPAQLSLSLALPLAFSPEEEVVSMEREVSRVSVGRNYFSVSLSPEMRVGGVKGERGGRRRGGGFTDCLYQMTDSLPLHRTCA